MKSILASHRVGQKTSIAMVLCLLALSVSFPTAVNGRVLLDRTFALSASIAIGVACGRSGCRTIYGSRPILYTMWLAECGLLGMVAVAVVVEPVLLVGRASRWEEEHEY